MASPAKPVYMVGVSTSGTDENNYVFWSRAFKQQAKAQTALREAGFVVGYMGASQHNGRPARYAKAKDVLFESYVWVTIVEVKIE